MTTSNHKQIARSGATFLEAGFTGWACLLAAAGVVLLGLCVVFSLVFASLETLTLSMAGGAFAFSGTCWLLGRLAGQAAVEFDAATGESSDRVSENANPSRSVRS
jgi:urea transporter